MAKKKTKKTKPSPTPKSSLGIRRKAMKKVFRKTLKVAFEGKEFYSGSQQKGGEGTLVQSVFGKEQSGVICNGSLFISLGVIWWKR